MTFQRSLMVRDASNGKGMVTSNLITYAEDHLPLEKLKSSTKFTWKQVKKRKNGGRSYCSSS